MIANFFSFFFSSNVALVHSWSWSRCRLFRHAPAPTQSKKDGSGSTTLVIYMNFYLWLYWRVECTAWPWDIWMFSPSSCSWWVDPPSSWPRRILCCKERSLISLSICWQEQFFLGKNIEQKIFSSMLRSKNIFVDYNYRKKYMLFCFHLKYHKNPRFNLEVRKQEGCGKKIY